MNESNVVKGLYYFQNMIKHDKSKSILANLDSEGWTQIGSNEKTKEIKKNKRRMVQQYGYYYDYTNGNTVKKAPDFPEFIKELSTILTQKCKEHGLIEDGYTFNQCIVNNYFQGEGISPHIDSLNFGKVIGCFTIGSGGTMKFTNNVEKKEYDVYTEDCSLYIMSSDARYKWLHQMEHLGSDIVNGIKIPRGRRISLTFRYVPT